MRARMLDLGPLRPWELQLVSAKDWIEAVPLRNAYEDGVRDANDEHEADRLLKATRA